MMSGTFKRAVSTALAALLMSAAVMLPSPTYAQTSRPRRHHRRRAEREGRGGRNATVRAVNLGTNASREATSSGEGAYEISQLVPGTYRVEVEAQGFSKLVQEDVVVNVLQRTTVNAALKVGQITDVVNVTSENAALVETTKTDVASASWISAGWRTCRSTGARSPLSAVLIPGATLQPSFDPTKARVGTFSVGGSTGRNLNVTIDGGDNLWPRLQITYCCSITSPWSACAVMPEVSMFG